MKSFLTIFLIVVALSSLYPQTLRETRAVWIATNYRLDWPPHTYDAEIQKEELINIFNNIINKNFNTVYFQVRSSGTTLFNSSYEPFSYYITGESKKSSSYDPLEYAVNEAHKKGLELHAWVNVMNCYAGSDDLILEDKRHIVNTHPNWIVKNYQTGKRTYWLDPGIPEVKEYLIKVFLEIVNYYNIDGIHLDYIRYPGQEFDDYDTYTKYNNGESLDEWRRNNITDFIYELSRSIRKVKPFLKIGAAPFGIYKNVEGAIGTEGFSEVYQDSRKWLEEGIVDYIAPQIYWDLKTNPRFDVLANEWVNNSFGKNVVLGIAAYKDEVYKELDKLIDYSRQINSSGVSFFRYAHIKNYNFYSFRDKAFPAIMPWMDGFNPRPPTNLKYEFTEGSPSKIILTWNKPLYSVYGDSTAYYALYKFNSDSPKFNSENLLEVINSGKTTLQLVIDKPRQVKYYFALKSLDKLWNESEHFTNVVEVTVPNLEKLLLSISSSEKPILIKQNLHEIVLIIPSMNEQNVKLSIFDGEQYVLQKMFYLSRGKNILSSLHLPKLSGKLKLTYEKSGKEIILDF